MLEPVVVDRTKRPGLVLSSLARVKQVIMLLFITRVVF